MSIYDTMQAITAQKEISFEAEKMDIEKVTMLLKAQKLPVATGLNEPNTLVLCTFDGSTYLIDDETNLWDINAEGRLSVLAVGVLVSGVNGFAIDIASNPNTIDSVFEEVKNYLADDFIEELEEKRQA